MNTAAAPANETLAMFQQGFAFHRQGRLAEAEAIYGDVLRRDPGNPDANHLLGLLKHQSGRPAEAIDLISAAIAANPRVAGMYLNRSLAFSALGRFAEAMADAHRAIALNPAMPEAHYNRGNALQALGRLEEAVVSYDAAIAVNLGYAKAHGGRGAALLALNRPAEALPNLDAAVTIGPDNPEAHYHRGGARKALGRLDEALLAYDDAIARKPDHADAHMDRGSVLKDLGRLDEAIASYDRAIASAPDSAAAYFNRGNAYRQLGRMDDAIASYGRAIALQPDFAIAHHNSAVCLLTRGELEVGFREYEWRRRCPDFDDPRYGLGDPWSGEDIRDKALFIFPELFLGDMIQFCRYARLAERRGAKVVLAAPRPLHALLRSLSPSMELIAGDAEAARFDVQCALMSLPLAFGTTLQSIPAEVPYLSAEPVRVERWRRQIGDRGFRIGVCWQGSTLAYSTPMQRSFPLTALGEVSKLPGVRLISLQKHDGLDQLAALPPGMTVEVLGETFDAGADAFLDTAAVMASCDLVISADTAVAHLAGALGVPTWIALPYVADWRWMQQRDDSPWYPTVRLFRQDAPGDWAGVFSRLETALRARLRETTHA